jgi:hypothetical protein
VLQASADLDFDEAFSSVARLRAGGLVISSDSFFFSRSKELATLAVRHAVPTIFGFREFVAAGGLMSYGGSLTESFRWVSVAPDQGLIHHLYQNGELTAVAPRVRRARWEKLSAAQNKTAARMVMRNAADRRLFTPLKDRHESPNFRKPFYLAEPHRHRGPTSRSQ